MKRLMPSVGNDSDVIASVPSHMTASYSASSLPRLDIADSESADGGMCGFATATGLGGRGGFHCAPAGCAAEIPISRLATAANEIRRNETPKQAQYNDDG
jgi:hypothetical protein